MIIFTREYTNARVAKSLDKLTDVIVSIYCVIRGIDETTGIFESAGRDFDISTVDPENFVPFDKVTAELLDKWILNKPEYISLEKFLSNSIQDRIDSNYEIKPLPFNPPEEVIIEPDVIDDQVVDEQTP